MVKTTGPYPLFWYIYSPSTKRGRKSRGAEGFNVALYSDSTLVYSKYDQKNQLRERNCFQLPPEVTDTYLMILQSETWWLRSLPLNIRAHGHMPEYSCMFGFVGHPVFTCDELHKTVLLSDANRNGVYARRLNVMMEFIAEILFSHGVLLQLDNFTWDWNRIRPIQQPQYAPQAPAAEAGQEMQNPEEWMGMAQ